MEPFLDYDLETFIFKEPITLMYSDGEKPLCKIVKTMEELVELIDEIEESGYHYGIGNYSIDFQLWFALARRAKLFSQK